MKRQSQAESVKVVLEAIMQEIDRWGMMRKPSWGSVRALLLLIPLLERAQCLYPFAQAALILAQDTYHLERAHSSLKSLPLN